MNVEQALNTAISRLQTSRLDNEAQVKQAVILPVLRALDWDDTDPATFRPEFRVDEGYVDYALLDWNQRPLVFIEAKRTGKLDTGGEEQLFRYANNKGVPFLILTDGNRWDFYLSMAAGIPQERRFYRLELELERKISEYAKFLHEYLQRDRVVSGEAKSSAEERHASARNRSRAQRAIANVWQELLTEPDEALRDRLTERVEIACGTEPEQEDVEAFLRQVSSLPITTEVIRKPAPHASSRVRTSTSTVTTAINPVPPSPQSTPQQTGKRIVGFLLGEERAESGTARGTLSDLLIRLSRDDPSFMERYYEETVGRTRRLVARNRTELYDMSHLTDKYAMQLENGWWLGTNLSQSSVRKHIETACGVAGLEYNVHLKLIER